LSEEFVPASDDRYSSYQSRPPEEEGPSVVGYASLPLAWLVPGLGHIVIGERVRGAIFLVTIHLLFALGLLFGGMRSIKPVEQPIWTYTQYLNGWPMLVANHFWEGFAREYLPPPSGGKSAREIAFDRDAPPRPDINGQPDDRIKYTTDFIAADPAFAFHPKVHDMGAVYCGISGMLNLLVMFDLLLRVTGSQRQDPAAARRHKRAALVPDAARPVQAQTLPPASGGAGGGAAG
jgi:hypothetical protein